MPIPTDEGNVQEAQAIIHALNTYCTEVQYSAPELSKTKLDSLEAVFTRIAKERDLVDPTGRDSIKIEANEHPSEFADKWDTTLRDMAAKRGFVVILRHDNFDLGQTNVRTRINIGIPDIGPNGEMVLELSEIPTPDGSPSKLGRAGYSLLEQQCRNENVGLKVFPATVVKK